MAGMFTALGQLGRSGQDYATKQNEMATAGFNAITDEELYASAIQRYAQEVAAGNVADTPGNASSFIQNQYLLNKTGGSRDLGGQYTAFGLSNNLDERTSGMQKLALSGVNPAVQTDQGTVLMGTDSSRQKPTGKFDDFGRPIYEDIVPGNAGDSMLLGQYTALSELEAKGRQQRMADAANKKREFKLNYKNKGSELKDNLAKSFLRKDEMDSFKQALLTANANGAKEENGALVNNDGEVIFSEDNYKKLKDVASKSGFKVKDGMIYLDGQTEDFWYSDGNKRLNINANVKEVYNPATGDTETLYTWTDGKVTYKDVPNELATYWLSNNAGFESKEAISEQLKDYEFQGNAKVSEGQSQRLYTELTKIEDGGITIPEAIGLLGDGAASAIEKYYKDFNNGKDAIGLADMTEMMETFTKDSEFTKRFNNEQITAFQGMVEQLRNKSKYDAKEGGLSNADKVDMKFKVQKEAVSSFTSSVGEKAIKEITKVIEDANELSNAPNLNKKIVTTDKEIIIDGVPISFKDLLDEDKRDKVAKMLEMVQSTNWGRK